MGWGATVLPGGWVQYFVEGGVGVLPTVLLQFSEADGGRLVVTRVHIGGPVYVGGGGPVTSDELRLLQLGAVEQFMNSPDIAPKVRAAIADPSAAAVDDAMALAEDEVVGQERRYAAFFVDDDPDHTDRVNAIRKELAIGAVRKSDEFYRLVASELARSTAPDLASSTSVPVTTVHRWTKEARRRGLLPPTRRKQPQKKGSDQ